MDALLGVALVAKVPSQQPEVVFQYTQQELGPSTGSTVATDRCSCDSAREASGLRISPSTDDIRATQLECFGIPVKIFAKLMLPDEELCNRPFYLEIDAGWRETSHRHDAYSHLHFVSFPCNVSEFSRPSDRPPQQQQQQAAQLQQPLLPQPLPQQPLPQQLLPQQPATQQPLPQQPLPQQQLPPPLQQAQQLDMSDLEPLDPRERVQHFNIVHILDSRRARRRDQHVSTLWQVSAHLSRGLVSEEARVGYLSKEVRRLAAALTEGQHGRAGDAKKQPEARARLSLDRLLADMFEGVHRHGYRSLRVNGSILCQVCVFRKLEAPAPPSAGQALALTCPREELQQELPIDSADIVRCVIAAVAPTASLGELMVRLALPLSTLQRVAQHLVYWKKARVVDVFQPHTRVAVAPGVDTGPNSLAAERFHEWQRSQKFKSLELTFSEVISAFASGQPLQRVREQLSSGADFGRVLEWLVVEGLVVQLATYCHFLPSRADGGRRPPCGLNVNAKIRREYCPQHLTEAELLLLAARAQDDHQHLFLCRFVVEFARAHCRTDGCRFAALAASFDRGGAFGLQQAERLIRKNRDIFVPYVCRC